MNYQLRVMTAADIPDALRLKDSVGWNQSAADVQRFLAASPQGCFVAECGDRVVGTAATIVYDEKLAWIGMVVVDPEFQGRGIGTALLERALRHLDSLQIPCIKLDATPRGEPLYQKLGFTAEYALERWMLARPKSVASLHFQQPGHSVSATLLQLDRQVFGVDRSELVQSLAAAAPEFCLEHRTGAEITGYLFGRHGSRADHAGPWMARTVEAAAALLDRFLERSSRERVFVDALCQNPWAFALIRARGFELSRPLTRMFRGTNEHPGRPDLLCAILGPEFG